MIEALKEDVASKPRYEYHSGGKGRVFDTQTGYSYVLEDEKQVRIEDPVGQQVIRKRLEVLDHTIGGVIRAR